MRSLFFLVLVFCPFDSFVVFVFASSCSTSSSRVIGDDGVRLLQHRVFPSAVTPTLLALSLPT
jgi:hypothetical protein